MDKKVSIIILNWNGWKDTIECLESLYQITYPNYDVIVVDNGSKDDSIEELREYCKGNIEVKSKFFTYSNKNKPIKTIEYNKEVAEDGGEKEREIDKIPSNSKLILIKNDENYGFAEGNNIAIRYALNALNPEYILLLNNDTVTDPQFLDELIKIAESEKDIGIVGPKVYFYDKPKTLQFTTAKIDLWKGHIVNFGFNESDTRQFDNIEETDCSPGSCFLTKKKVIEKIGLLDSNYFCYWEETDYCMRAKKAGYKLYYCPEARIWHKAGSSAKKKPGFYHYYMERNRFLFLRKHANTMQFCTSIFVFIVSDFWLKCGSFMLQRDLNNLYSFCKGVTDSLKEIISS